jgi:hypothetical protein
MLESEQELRRPVSASRWPNLLLENNLAFSGKTKDKSKRDKHLLKTGPRLDLIKRETIGMPIAV